MTSAISGFFLGLSLILAIGAQNAFVLRQGLRGQHVLAVVLTCALSDAVLIVAGVGGLGVLVEVRPALLTAFRWGGAAFLIAYGARAMLSAWRGGATLEEGGQGGSRAAAVGTALALTWLNPHVYLDTVILLGGISTTYDDPRAFGVGAVTASFVFFFSLGYGARFLRPIFARPASWRVLDAGIALVMWAIAAKLVAGA